MSMRRLSLFLACQHLSSGTNLRECKDRSGSRSKRFLCYVLIGARRFRVPLGYVYNRLSTTDVSNIHKSGSYFTEKKCVPFKKKNRLMPKNNINLSNIRRFSSYITEKIASVLQQSVDQSFYITSDKLKKLRGLSPQANYTDRETAACQRS
jgi:hypothetical protein